MLIEDVEAAAVGAVDAEEGAGRVIEGILRPGSRRASRAGTSFATPDRASVGFVRSSPDHLPLPAAVAERVARHLEGLAFDRLHGNFTHVIDSDARAVVRRSADRTPPRCAATTIASPEARGAQRAASHPSRTSATVGSKSALVRRKRRWRSSQSW